MNTNFIKPAVILGLTLLLALSSIAAAPAKITTKKTPPPGIPMIIDADTGVDDAAAIAYLLTRSDLVNVIGITAVAGNTSVDNAANNALILLDTAQRTNVPVVVGAAGPLVLAGSHQGLFVHGPDGFWFTGYQSPHDLSTLSHDAPGFLCANAAAGVTLLALGPLTNIANAVRTCPNQMKLYNIVWMGGAKSVDGEGNTPVSVFNPWYDPDAADVALHAGLTIRMITSDAARTATIDTTVFDKLASRGNALGKLIAPSLKQYASLFAKPTGRHGKLRVAMYDPATAVLAVHPDWATSQSALVAVQTADGVARGQTIFGFSLGEHVSMLASDAELSTLADQAFSVPGFDLYGALGPILYRQPDNAQVVLELDSNQVMKEWLTGVTK